MLRLAAAEIINARQNSAARRRMRAHAGKVVAARFGKLRLCFRIDAGGRWRAVLPQTAADAEIVLGAGGAEIRGGGALLRDLDEWRKENGARQIFADWFGADAAEFAAAAVARADLKNCLVKSGAAAAPDAAAEWNQKTAQLAEKLRELESRAVRLEERGGKSATN